MNRRHHPKAEPPPRITPGVLFMGAITFGLVALVNVLERFELVPVKLPGCPARKEDRRAQ